MNRSHPDNNPTNWSWSTGKSDYRNQRPRSPIQKILRESVDKREPARNFGDYDPVRPRPSLATRSNQNETRFQVSRELPNYPSHHHHNYYQQRPQNQNPSYNSPQIRPNSQRIPTQSQIPREIRHDMNKNWNSQSRPSFTPKAPDSSWKSSSPPENRDEEVICLEPGTSEALFIAKTQSKNLPYQLNLLPPHQMYGTTYYSYMIEFRPFKNHPIKESIQGHQSTDKLAAKESVFSSALRKLDSLIPEEVNNDRQEPQERSRVVLQRKKEGDEPTFKIAIPRGPPIHSGARKPPNNHHRSNKKYNI